MKFVLAALIFIFTSHVHAQFIGVKLNQKRYSVKQAGDRFTYRDIHTDRTFKIKPCNKKYFAHFWKEYDTKFKTMMPPEKDDKDYIRLNWKNKFYKVKTNSELGIFLQDMNSIIQNILFEENVNCNKVEDPGRY